MLVRQNPLIKNIIGSIRNRVTILLLVIALFITATVSILSIETWTSGGAGALSFASPIFTLLLFTLLVAFILEIRRDWVINATALLFALSTYFVAIGANTPSSFQFIYPLAAVATALLTTNRLTYWAVIGLISIRAIASFDFVVDGLQNPDASVEMVTVIVNLIVTVVPILVSIFTRIFIVDLESATAEARQTANLMETSATIGQEMTQGENLAQSLNRIVHTIRDRFAFYHVQIFLVDEESNYAYLTASSGDIGQQMLARGHRLPLDSNSIVGRVARAGEAIIARDTDRDSGHAFNELLPDTRSELGVAIVDNQGVIGVLDVQSRRPNAFTAVELRVLAVIANQLASAIRNARLFEAQSNNIRENKRLFIESETNLREIQRLNRQLTRQAWQDYLGGERRVEGVTLEGTNFDNRAEWTDEMLNASQRRRPIRSKEGDSRLAVPIELRGEVVGAIEIEADSDQDEDDVIDMVQAISQRLAVSLDNARLFEEAHQATAQEERVSELVSGYQTADTVDDLLKITLQGLAETLGAEKAAIRISTELDKTVTPSVPENNGANSTNNGGSANA